MKLRDQLIKFINSENDYFKSPKNGLKIQTKKTRFIPGNNTLSKKKKKKIRTALSTIPTYKLQEHKSFYVEIRNLNHYTDSRNRKNRFYS